MICFIKSWPAHSLLKVCQKASPNTCGYCGGTLIDRSTIITAAHCHLGSSFSFNFYLGCHELNDLSSCLLRVANCSRVKIHSFIFII